MARFYYSPGQLKNTRYINYSKVPGTDQVITRYFTLQCTWSQNGEVKRVDLKEDESEKVNKIPIEDFKEYLENAQLIKI